MSSDSDDEKSELVGLNVPFLNPPLALGITISLAGAWNKFNVKWTERHDIKIGSKTFPTDLAACRYLAQHMPELELFGATPVHRKESERWLQTAEEMMTPISSNFWRHLYEFNSEEMTTVRYLIHYSLALSDIYLWTALYKTPDWRNREEKRTVWKNAYSWYSFMLSHPCFEEGLKKITPPPPVKTKRAKRQRRK